MDAQIGNILFRDLSIDEALELAARMQNGDKKREVSKARSESMTLAAQKIDTGTGELNAIQYRTWQYLADHDCSGGIHVSEVAHAFGITAGTANSRLITLLNSGYAQRCAKGYYRALTPEGG